MTRRLATEVLVVGSGPGGALTAAVLAERGMDVTIVDEGDWVEPGSVPSYSRAEMEAKYRDRGMGVMAGSPPIAYVEGRCAGGGSEVNSGLFHRPPGELVDEWRVRFDIADFYPDDLDQYARHVEAALSVSTVPGDLPASSQALVRGAASLGWQAAEVPRVFRYEPGSTTHRDGAKQTMSRTYLPRAQGAGARLLVGCRVHRLRFQGRRATHAEARAKDAPGGASLPLTIEADHIFVCAGAIQTPALLQRSGIRGQVGRGLKVHPTVKVAARFPEPLDDHDTVSMVQVKHFAPDITLGGSASGPGYVALSLADSWATNRADAEDWPRIGVYYAAIRSDGRGRVRAIPGVRSPLVTYSLHESDLSRLARGAVALGELLLEAGAERLYPAAADAPPIEARAGLARLWEDVTRSRVALMTIHLLASVRMGQRRDLTGTDSFGRVWDLDNVYVNDASLVPDAPGVNPQGTIMAIAARNCDRFLADR